MTKHFYTRSTCAKTQRNNESGVESGLRQPMTARTQEKYGSGLLDAIKGDRERLARHILLEKQFSDLELQDKKKDGTSLFWATAKGFDDIVELLIWNGADVTSRAKTGCTPLHAACDAGHVSVARLLLKWGAPLDAVNKNGDSCLHMASRRGHLSTVLLLLDKETFNIDTENYNGKTPLQLAEANEHRHIVNILIEHSKKFKFQNEFMDAVASRTRSREALRKRKTWGPEEKGKQFEKDSPYSHITPIQSDSRTSRRDHLRKNRKSADLGKDRSTSNSRVSSPRLMRDTGTVKDTSRKNFKSGSVNPLSRSIKDDKTNEQYARILRSTNKNQPQDFSFYKYIGGAYPTPEEKDKKNSKDGHSAGRRPSVSASGSPIVLQSAGNCSPSGSSANIDFSYSVFNGYLNSTGCSMCNDNSDVNHKRPALPFRLQSLPYDYTDGINDLNKK